MATPTTPTTFVWLSPLPNWNGTTQGIAEGICIRRLAASEKLALGSSEPLLRHHEIPLSAEDGFWLCYGFENPHPSGDVRFRRRQDAAFKLMLHAMYAVQILTPIGAPNLFLLYRQTQDAPILEATQHRPAFIGAGWASQCNPPESFGDDAPIILERVHDAFQKPTLRLQIPVWLLEQGLSAPDRHIRILLWATGLDGVTRSGGVAAFAERLCRLLGPDVMVFPLDSTGRRPKYRVVDVVEDLYLLRTEMAHGLPFHEKFRRTVGFLGEDGAPISDEFVDYRYDHVLEECAGFLLSKALREMFLRNVAFDVQAGCWSEQG